jgi:hypothetical protein
MRELQYAVEGKAANLRTLAIDEPGHGGACHKYAIGIGHSNFDGIHPLVTLNFQNGPINVDGNGVNGIQHEDLLAIIIDRLNGFQSGLYACSNNQEALDHLRAALECLQRRTKARIARGVEGTHTV